MPNFEDKCEHGHPQGVCSFCQAEEASSGLSELLPCPCPFCGATNIDLSFARGFKGGDESKPIIGAGCSSCGATGPLVEFESVTGYEEAQTAWDKRAR